MTLSQKHSFEKEITVRAPFYFHHFVAFPSLWMSLWYPTHSPQKRKAHMIITNNQMANSKILKTGKSGALFITVKNHYSANI